MEIDTLYNGRGQNSKRFLFEGWAHTEGARQNMTLVLNLGQSKSLLSVQKNVNINCAVSAVQSLL